MKGRAPKILLHNLLFWKSELKQTKVVFTGENRRSYWTISWKSLRPQMLDIQFSIDILMGAHYDKTHCISYKSSFAKNLKWTKTYIYIYIYKRHFSFWIQLRLLKQNIYIYFHTDGFIFMSLFWISFISFIQIIVQHMHGYLKNMVSLLGLRTYWKWTFLEVWMHFWPLQGICLRRDEPCSCDKTVKNEELIRLVT